jgi:hypothetical protein
LELATQCEDLAASIEAADKRQKDKDSKQ